MNDAPARTYGHFDDDAREYVITDPRTPVKWTNYVGTLAFGGIVDHTGGSLICKGDPALNRIVKYIPQLPDSDFKGESLYLRVRRGGDTKVFSPFFVPTLDDYDTYRCHVGLGYQRIISGPGSDRSAWPGGHPHQVHRRRRQLRQSVSGLVATNPRHRCRRRAACSPATSSCRSSCRPRCRWRRRRSGRACWTIYEPRCNPAASHGSARLNPSRKDDAPERPNRFD